MKSYSIITWNIMGRSPVVSNKEKIYQHLKKMSADIICLQEVHRDINYLQKICKLYKYHYVPDRFSSDNIDGGGNVILSKWPITKADIVETTSISKKKRKHYIDQDKIIYCDININNQLIRIYNVHLRLKEAGIQERFNSLKTIINIGKDIKYKQIIAGDFNSVVPRQGIGRKIIMKVHKIKSNGLYLDNKFIKEDERQIVMELFQSNDWSFDKSGVNQPTWRLPILNLPIFNLKLDWIFAKNINKYKTNLMPFYISDHRPIKFSLG